MENDTTENSKLAYEMNKSVNKLHTKINKIVENKTRQEFGYLKIGEGNISESILLNIIKNIYSGQEIIEHHRPFWLDGLELDIFLPKLNLGFEYQGQQHFHPIKLWGGEEALKLQRERDQKKRILCKNMKIKLIEIDYTEPLEINYIKNEILNSA